MINNNNQNEDLINFYNDFFNDVENQKAKEKLKQIDIKNKNRSINEIENDLKDFDFKQIF